MSAKTHFARCTVEYIGKLQRIEGAIEVVAMMTLIVVTTEQNRINSEKHKTKRLW